MIEPEPEAVPVRVLQEPVAIGNEPIGQLQERFRLMTVRRPPTGPPAVDAGGRWVTAASISASAAHTEIRFLPDSVRTIAAPRTRPTDSLVLARTSRRMTAEGIAFPPFRVARLATWLALPLVALGVLRLFSPLDLPGDASQYAAWLTTVTSGVLALTGLIAALVALARGFRSAGMLRDLLEGAGLGALSAAAAATALSGPSQSPVFPTPVLPLGFAATALALLAAEVVPPLLVTGRGPRLAAAALIFGWVELGAGGRAPWAAGIAHGCRAHRRRCGAARNRGGHRAGWRSRTRSRSEWLAGLAAGGLAIGLARPGTVDVMPGLLTLAAGHDAGGLDSTAITGARAGDEAMRAVALLSAPNGTDVEGVPPQADEALRLARELRGTITELLAARQTVELQRVELERAASVDGTTGTVDAPRDPRTPAGGGRRSPPIRPSHRAWC